MNKRQLIVVCVIGILIALSGCNNTHSQSDFEGKNRYWVGGFSNDKVVENFARQFKDAVIKQDRKRVASMINYPLQLMSNGKMIKNSKDFIANYDYIIDKNAYQEITNSHTSDMFSNYQGVMLGDGVAWFGGNDSEPLVKAVGNARVPD
ncbi:hypothetical protein HQ550_04250 [bacterium]|nr:hypothetical protein [bacterium]